MKTIYEIYTLKGWDDAEKAAKESGYLCLIPIESRSRYISAKKKIGTLIDQSGLNGKVGLRYYSLRTGSSFIHKVELNGNDEVQLLNSWIGNVTTHKTLKALFMIEDRTIYDEPHRPEKCKIVFKFDPLKMKLAICYSYFVRSTFY